MIQGHPLQISMNYVLQWIMFFRLTYPKFNQNGENMEGGEGRIEFYATPQERSKVMGRYRGAY